MVLHPAPSAAKPKALPPLPHQFFLQTTPREPHRKHTERRDPSLGLGFQGIMAPTRGRTKRPPSFPSSPKLNASSCYAAVLGKRCSSPAVMEDGRGGRNAPRWLARHMAVAKLRTETARAAPQVLLTGGDGQNRETRGRREGGTQDGVRLLG